MAVKMVTLKVWTDEEKIDFVLWNCNKEAADELISAGDAELYVPTSPV